jgi:hypothetical protein
VKIDELEKLRAALDALDAAAPLEQARALGPLIEDAKAVVGALSRARAAVLAGLTAPGAEYYRRTPALSIDLPLHRSKIDEALAAHRRTARGALVQAEEKGPG